MDVTRRRVDVRMTQQCLHHREIDTGFGERGAETVTQRVGVTARHTGEGAVITEDRTQPRRAQRLTARRALRHHEQTLGRRLGPLGKQVGLDHPSDVHIERDAPFLGALAAHPQPSSADVHVRDSKCEHLTGAQTTEHHQPRDRAVRAPRRGIVAGLDLRDDLGEEGQW